MQKFITFFKKMTGRKSTLRSREQKDDEEKNSKNKKINKIREEGDSNNNASGSSGILQKRPKLFSSRFSTKISKNKYENEIPSSSLPGSPSALSASSSSSTSTSHLKSLQMRLRSQSQVNNSNVSLRSRLTQITTPTINNSNDKLYGAKKKINQQQQSQEKFKSISTTITNNKKRTITSSTSTLTSGSEFEIKIQQQNRQSTTQTQHSQQQQKLKKIKIMGVNNVALLYKDLKAEWSKKNCNLLKCGSYLDQLKIELTKLSYLPTEGVPIPKNDLIVARDVLEIAVEYSVAKKDIPAFERYISQLKCYYYDYRQIIGESDNMYKLLGLNLLYLLSVNRVSEFHTELELLSTEVIQRNRYIRPILSLEQYIMEGRYNKIFQARGSLPTELYNFFMDILVETVRDEIGACLERSYEKISLHEAAKRLNLKNKDEVKTFGVKRNWSLGSDDVYYFMAKAAKPKEPLPSIELAEQAMFYARELEMIV